MDPCDSDKSGQRTNTPPKEQSNSTPQDSKAAEKKLATDSPMSVNPSQSPATTNAASGGLVYVRRRVEVDTNKPKDILVSSSTPALSPGPESSPQGPTSHRLDWEERYHHLQILLNKLNQTDHHLHMLWSLSSGELSKHAVDLEKRSIQLSLEEAREMQRVAALNVLGRCVNNSLKSTSNEGE